MQLVRLPADGLEQAWPLLAPFVEQMAERFPDDWPVRETWRQGLSGELAFWVIWEPDEKQAYGVVGTKLGEKPSGKKVLVVEIATGTEHKRWAHLISTLEDYAKSNGCRRVEIRGRGGWARALDGYRLERDPLLTKEL